MSKSKKTTGWIIALCVLLAALIAGGIGVWKFLTGMTQEAPVVQNRETLQDYEKILPGISINGVDVSGLTQEEAAIKVSAALENEEIDDAFTVQFQDQTLTISGYTTRSIPTLTSAIREAYQHGREGVTYLDDALAQVSPLALMPAVESTIDEAVIRAEVDKFSDSLDGRPTDCRIHTDEDVIRVIKGRDGRAIDADAVYRDILSALAGGKTELTETMQLTRSGDAQLKKLHETFCQEGSDAHWDSETQQIVPEVVGREFDLDAALEALNVPEDTEISIPIIRVEPTITTDMLRGELFMDELAHYSSPHTAIANRTNNLIHACEAINGTVLNAGEVFSFNGVVGERTYEKGYKDAAIYVDGQTTDGLGGGVCQVASTIYYCALMANLEIVERSEHMYFVEYVPPGMDATVYWGALDFKFRNSTNYPLRIDASVSDGYVHITLCGTNEDGCYAEMTYEQLSMTPWEYVTVEDETKPAGYAEVTSTPYTGRVIRTYRNVYDKDGQLISSTIEDKSTYHKRDHVTTVGKQPGDPDELPEDPGTTPEDPGPIPEDPGPIPGEEPDTPQEPETPQEPDTPQEPVVPQDPDMPMDPEPPAPEGPVYPWPDDPSGGEA